MGGVRKVRLVVKLRLAAYWQFSGDQKVRSTLLKLMREAYSVTYITFPQILFYSHRFTVMLKLVLVKMPQTAQPPGVKRSFWTPL